MHMWICECMYWSMNAYAHVYMCMCFRSWKEFQHILKIAQEILKHKDNQNLCNLYPHTKKIIWNLLQRSEHMPTEISHNLILLYIKGYLDILWKQKELKKLNLPVSVLQESFLYYLDPACSFPGTCFYIRLFDQISQLSKLFWNRWTITKFLKL